MAISGHPVWAGGVGADLSNNHNNNRPLSLSERGRGANAGVCPGKTRPTKLPSQPIIPIPPITVQTTANQTTTTHHSPSFQSCPSEFRFDIYTTFVLISTPSARNWLLSPAEAPAKNHRRVETGCAQTFQRRSKNNRIMKYGSERGSTGSPTHDPPAVSRHKQLNDV